VLFKIANRACKEVLGSKKGNVREHVIYPYIVDVFIRKRGIVLEADGGYHKNRISYDSKRDAFLESLGLTVLRLENETILNYGESVGELIKNAVQLRENYKPSPKFMLNNLMNSDFGKTEKGKLLIAKLERI
jgi:very-short-patch-repair endonuclease